MRAFGSPRSPFRTRRQGLGGTRPILGYLFRITPLCTLRARKNGELVRKREPQFCNAVSGTAPRHVPGDIELQERLQLGGNLAGDQHVPFQAAVNLLTFGFHQRGPFARDEPVFVRRRVLP